MVATACGACHSRSSEQASPQSYQLDSREWVPVQKHVQPNSTRTYVLELLPSGETLDNWTELITVEHFSTPRKSIEPREFESAFLKKLSAGHPGVGYHVVADSPQLLMFTWQAIADSRLENQQGLVSVSSSPQELKVVQYINRHGISDEQLSHWQDVLSKHQPPT